jgi:hypothetical protein
MAKARGRPKLPTKARKGGRLEIRVSEIEMAQIEEAARRAGKSLSAWLRELAINAAAR